MRVAALCGWVGTIGRLCRYQFSMLRGSDGKHSHLGASQEQPLHQILLGSFLRPRRTPSCTSSRKNRESTTRSSSSSSSSSSSGGGIGRGELGQCPQRMGQALGRETRHRPPGPQLPQRDPLAARGPDPQLRQGPQGLGEDGAGGLYRLEAEVQLAQQLPHVLLVWEVAEPGVLRSTGPPEVRAFFTGTPFTTPGNPLTTSGNPLTWRRPRAGWRAGSRSSPPAWAWSGLRSRRETGAEAAT
jgi:hypothetical protein